ncbi:MAG: AlpA family phage regulatory protein [Burkholderiales bacterium]|nr:AlpA family phage regulatory protein [Burkholderiales bacterium]
MNKKEKNRQSNAQPSVGWLSKKSLRIYLGGPECPLSRNTIYGWMKTQDFPEPIYISHQFPIWRKEDVDEWLASRQQKSKA